MISFVVDPSLTYPDSDDFYSPSERFPEYRHDHIARSQNLIYRAVRNSFAQGGFDQEHFNTPFWNPLGGFIRPGNRVFVLCNFVFNRLSNESAENFKAKCTHGSVLRALLDYLLLAVGGTGQVAFGNAPMQFCRWDSVLSDTGAKVVQDFYRTKDPRVEAKDLRLFVAQRTRLGRVVEIDKRQESAGVQVNLGDESLLAELDHRPPARYRVMNYNSKRTEAFHAQGSHIYVINRQVLESDVIVNLSKLKTHEKVGITCALKNCVGSVAHKDSLPHHRFGPPEVGGDEYPPDKTGLMRKISAFHDRVWQMPPHSKWGNILRIIDLTLRRVEGLRAPITEGAWCGNDTAWRMVLDLARILRYATPTGEINSSPVRKHLAFIDGVIGGEGQGPLSPKSVPSGMLLFSDNPVSADFAAARLMGFDPDRIPMIRQAQKLNNLPLIEHNLANEQILYNGQACSLSDLINLVNYHYEPPLGWKEKL